MPKIDLHVHSKYSDRPSEWFLQRIGAAESYTEPLQVFNTALSRGMDFVTITDHNVVDGSFELKEMFPDKVLTGVESTAYFPENGCKVHILIYGLNRPQFDIIQKTRKDIYQLRDFIKQENLPYSVAHATYSVNGRMTPDYLEKLILLFDVFEGRNGSRSRQHNILWTKLLKNLDENHIHRLYEKHKIEPLSETPWIKGITGGSDDHSGMFIGKTWTGCNGNNVHDVREALRNKLTFADGRHNDFTGLTFAIYKIACDYLTTKSSKFVNLPIGQLTDVIFNEKKLSMVEKFKINRFKANAKAEGSPVKQKMAELISELSAGSNLDIDVKLGIVYDKVSELTDVILKEIFEQIGISTNSYDISGVIKGFSSFIPAAFLSLPFFSSFTHMTSNRNLIMGIAERFNLETDSKNKKVLWFTDTLNDLNGVSVTLKRLGWETSRRDINMKLVASLLPEEMTNEIPPNLINLPVLASFELPYYENYKVRIPSMMKALKEIYEFEADEIIISTPGPIGILGLMLAYVMKVKCTGVYHTDFSGEVDEIAGDDVVTELVDAYTNWFFKSMDEIRVPTKEYIDILSSKGMPAEKMKVFPRGLDTGLFSPSKKQVEKDGVHFIYAGRVSKDKNLDFLINAYEITKSRHKDLRLTIAGNGPYFDELKNICSKDSSIHFTGRVLNTELPPIYNSADIFVFPSMTDTFGMAVLEAQSCGLPAIVTTQGGPKEIVLHEETGLHASANNVDNWVNALERMINMKTNNLEAFEKMGQTAREKVIARYSWESVFNELLYGTEKMTEKKMDSSPVELVKMSMKLLAG